MDPSSAAITAAAWAWDKYGSSLTDKAAESVRGRWTKFGWKRAAEAYRAKIRKLYGTMQIMGMAEPVPLDDIFTDAYILDKPTAFGRFDIERLKQQMSVDPDSPPQARRINGLRLVRGKTSLFILGKPGAGKTTFLKYVALQSAEQTIDRVPIFISLKEWADSGSDLMPFIAERFDICDFPAAQPFVEQLLRGGGAIVLFDGLDEVNQESGERDRQTRAMNNFIEKYERTQCLITCRIAATDYSFKPFSYVEIADFDERQIKTFVGNWFRNREGERDEATCRKFLAEFSRPDNKGLRDLARTPLLLTLLCLAFDETLTFPRRRVEIYEEAVDALLKKWDASRRIKRDEAYHKLSLGHKENMLARVAAVTFEENKYFIPQAELERLITDYVRNVPPHDTVEEIDGEAILKSVEVQHGIFVERARGIYSFSHLTLQEYFTARYIVANAAKGTLTSLVREHCADERWREVFLLTTSMLADASQFMTTFRRGVDELLGGDEKLGAVLTWAERKSKSTQADSWAVRLSYLSFVVPVVHNFEGARVIEELNVPDLTLDSALYDANELHLARDLARDLGLSDLAEELDALMLPGDKATAAERQKFTIKLRSLMIKHRDNGHDWGLTETQEGQLDSYLTAAGLLHDCLELAFMPPAEKREILNSLYLPPPADEKAGA